MLFIRSFLIFSFLSTSFNIGNAVDCRSSSTNDGPAVSFKIIVDLHGRGNFTRVQDAINSIPSGNSEWTGILVNSGIYREQVIVPRDKPCIVLQGHAIQTTVIAFDAHESTNTSATFTSLADNFIARHIAFKNTYNHKAHNTQTIKQAVAAQINGDKSSFYMCGFYGLQDTLWDVSGRHLFTSCHIEGAIDFIWGNGQSIYEDCRIKVLGDELGSSYGYITAQGRRFENETSGFVFIGGNVHGKGSVDLGRAYGPYSRVIFDGTMLDAIVRPEGWSAWDKNEQNIVYAEANCHGPGAEMSKRVTWLKKFSPVEVHKYTNRTFIDNEGWILKQPALSFV